MKTVPIWLLMVSSAWGANLTDPEAAIEAGSDGLRANWGFNWYDASTDALKRVDVTPPRRSSWDWEWLEDLAEWIPDLGDFFTLLAWILIAVALGVIAHLLIRTYLGRESANAKRADHLARAVDPTQIDRVEQLPVGVRNPRIDFLQEAERHYRAGNLSEAIIYLFSHELLELDRHNLLRLTKGKTNRQYVREVRLRALPTQAPLVELLRETMQLFEAAFFGARKPQPPAFEACWQHVEHFHELLNPITEANQS